jgi:hypothetical protein
MNRDFLDLLHAFLTADVRFLVVGAYAVAVHGHPRATGDLDLWVDPTPLNAARVYAALQAFGAPLHELRPDDLERPGIVFQMGLPPARIDILTSVSGLEFEEAWTSRIVETISEMRIPFIGRDGLIKNKLATGRPQDLADVAALRDIAKGRQGVLPDSE